LPTIRCPLVSFLRNTLTFTSKLSLFIDKIRTLFRNSTRPCSEGQCPISFYAHVAQNEGYIQSEVFLVSPWRKMGE
jgi:hypothetical protein